MSRGRDVAEGTETILFKVAAGSTLEALMVVEESWMKRGLSWKGSSPFWRARATTKRRGGIGDGVC